MLIVGSGGHAMDCFNVLKQLSPKQEIVFFNNTTPNFKFDNSYFKDYKVISTTEELKNHFAKNKDFILGIGNPIHRDKLNSLMIENGGVPQNLISKDAIIGSINNSLGASVTVLNGTVITINTSIGNGTLINSNSTITHDCTIGDFVEIGPGVTVSGNCIISNHSFIGAGATLIPKIKIGEHSIVAAGAVVINDVPPFSMVAGNPAIIKKSLK